MLRRLRLKFIFINMSIVTCMLLLIFGLLYYSTERSIERESLQMMNNIALSPGSISLPTESMEAMEDVRLPYFSITVNRAGETIELDGGYYDLSDEDLIQEILDATTAAHTDIGVLETYNLRYLRMELPIGECFVYTDMSSETSMLHHLLRNFLIIGVLAFLIFLTISILLARWTVRPVEKAWQLQKQFVADASHELKTPLTVIITDAEMLKERQQAPLLSPEGRENKSARTTNSDSILTTTSPADSDMAELHDSMHTATPSITDSDTARLLDSILTMSLQMRGLVENLLELARIDGGSVQRAMGPVNLSELAEEVCMTFEPVFFEAGLNFTYRIQPQIRMQGSDIHLKQLCGILLDNALKYASPAASVTLSLERISQHRCRLTVANQGDPIPEEELPLLFRRFYRSDRARTHTRNTGDAGYGLGLSIAESITKEHHGSIHAESIHAESITRQHHGSIHAESITQEHHGSIHAESITREHHGSIHAESTAGWNRFIVDFTSDRTV